MFQATDFNKHFLQRAAVKWRLLALLCILHALLASGSVLAMEHGSTVHEQAAMVGHCEGGFEAMPVDAQAANLEADCLYECSVLNMSTPVAFAGLIIASNNLEVAFLVLSPRNFISPRYRPPSA